jgi:hypothetical protein
MIKVTVVLNPPIEIGLESQVLLRDGWAEVKRVS